MDCGVQTRTIYFDAHSFYMCHTCKAYLRFLGKSEPSLGPIMALFVFVVLAASNYNGVKGTGSLFCFENLTDLVTTPLSLSALRPFYLLIIKSYHSPAPLCLIHLQALKYVPSSTYLDLGWGGDGLQ